MLFTPAHTTATGVRPSSVKSALISNAIYMWDVSLWPQHTYICLHCSAPLCTPPMPPVTKTGIPAALAKIMVLATVVAPALFWCWKWLDQHQIVDILLIASWFTWDSTTDKSRLDVFCALGPILPKCSSVSSVRPRHRSEACTATNNMTQLTDMHFAIQQSNGGRNRSLFTNDVFHCFGCLDILRVWHAYYTGVTIRSLSGRPTLPTMTDNSRLESNNRPLSVDCCFDLGSNHKLFGDRIRMKAAFACSQYATCG